MKSLTKEQIKKAQLFWNEAYITRFQRALTEMAALRKIAIKEKMHWEKVKSIYNGGLCYLCQACNTTCGYCTWFIFNNDRCHDYENHEEALARYTDWQKKLTALKREFKSNKGDENAN